MGSNDILNSIKSYYDVYWGINSIYEQWARKHGLTINSLFTLSIIQDSCGQCTSRLLCEKLLLPKQTVNTILDSLEKKGYIMRETAADDKRSKNIVFTENGREYAAPLLADLLEFEQEAFRNMTAEERDWMIQGNYAFYHSLKQL